MQSKLRDNQFVEFVSKENNIEPAIDGEVAKAILSHIEFETRLLI